MCSGIEAFKKCLEDASCYKKSAYRASFNDIRQQYKDKFNEAPKDCGIQSKNIVPLVLGGDRGCGGGNEKEAHLLKNPRESHHVYYLLPNEEP